jgi:hypothetical protein
LFPSGPIGDAIARNCRKADQLIVEVLHLHAELLRRSRSEGGEISLLVALSIGELSGFSLVPEVSRVFGEFGITIEFELTDASHSGVNFRSCERRRCSRYSRSPAVNSLCIFVIGCLHSQLITGTQSITRLNQLGNNVDAGVLNDEINSTPEQPNPERPAYRGQERESDPTDPHFAQQSDLRTRSAERGPNRRPQPPRTAHDPEWACDGCENDHPNSDDPPSVAGTCAFCSWRDWERSRDGAFDRDSSASIVA